MIELDLRIVAAYLLFYQEPTDRALAGWQSTAGPHEELWQRTHWGSFEGFIRQELTRKASDAPEVL